MDTLSDFRLNVCNYRQQEVTATDALQWKCTMSIEIDALSLSLCLLKIISGVLNLMPN